MMKLFCPKFALPTICLLVLLCQSCGTKQPHTGELTDTVTETKQAEVKQPETKPEIVESKPKELPAAEEISEPNVVAKTGDYTITRGELEKRLMEELSPRYEEYDTETEPVDAKSILLKMVAEKAMIIEARKQNYIERETIRSQIKRFTETRLVRLLLQKYLQGKIEATDSEIEETIKTNPKLNRTRAKAMLESTKANNLINEYYNELLHKLNVKKVGDNFSKAAEIHQRLLLHPKEPRKVGFIRMNQVENELTEQEKEIILSTFDNGKFILKDWFEALFEIAPPSRPKDLGTPEGVERLLDRALRKPIFVAEAKLAGLDKDENFLKQLKEEEDMRLLYEIRNEKIRDVNIPENEEQIIAYFNKNKELFGASKTLKIDQIWCQNLKTAQTVKGELNEGKDFETVRQQYSLEKKGKPFNSRPSNEGIFFDDLWKGEPNEIVGPVRGFYRNEIKWRIVKILEKKPGELKEYSSDMKNRVKWKMRSEQINDTLTKYRKELLEKYSYEIYADRIKDIDPLNIP